VKEKKNIGTVPQEEFKREGGVGTFRTSDTSRKEEGGGTKEVLYRKCKREKKSIIWKKSMCRPETLREGNGGRNASIYQLVEAGMRLQTQGGLQKKGRGETGGMGGGKKRGALLVNQAKTRTGTKVGELTGK